jgi:hypothetical protein
MMRGSLSIIGLMLVLTACKKENADIQHTVQFASNITDPDYYFIVIDNTSHDDISATYPIPKGADVSLTLLKAGGDTATVNSGDSLWIRGGIIVDGQLVKSYAGYRDATLTYHLKQ